MFEQLLQNERLHGLVPFVRLWYAVPSQYKWRDENGNVHNILQGDGGEQGDALMPALFCLALHSALEHIKSGLPEGAEIVAYLDDIYVVCNPDDVANIYDAVRTTLRDRCRIDVNIGKLAAWSKNRGPCPAGLAERSPTAWVCDRPDSEQGLRVLGAPFGTNAYVEQFGNAQAVEKAKLLNLLPKLPSLQMAWLLLYYCAVPRLNHRLRTTPPSQSQVAAQTHDANVVRTFRELFGIPGPEVWDSVVHGISFNTWVAQAQLPLRYAGLGLRNSSRLAPAAYWASWADSLHNLSRGFPGVGRDILGHLTAMSGANIDGIPNCPDCLVEAERAGRTCDDSGWAGRASWDQVAAGERPPAPPEQPMALGEWTHGWQFHASDPLEHRAHCHVLQELGGGPTAHRNAATMGKARVQASMGPYAAIWLTVCPTTKCLTLDNKQMGCAIRRRLGIGVLFEGPDPRGHSTMTTNDRGRLNIRHAHVVVSWRQVFTEAGALIPDRNVERLLAQTHLPVPTNDLRRMDLIVPGLNVEHGLPLFCDVTVVSPISGNSAPRAGTSNRGGRLLELAERENNATYADVITTGLGSLQCLGVEVFGRWGRQCVQLVPALARERCRNLPGSIRRGTALGLLHRWWGMLGMAVQRSVADMVLQTYTDLLTNHLEPPCPLDELEVI